MEEMKRKNDVALQLRKVAEDLCLLADRMQEFCADTSDGCLETVSEPEPVKKENAISLEKVRGVLAELSRTGKTEEVRGLIQKFGADRLSAVDPKDYQALLSDAEGLKDE